MKAFLTEYLRYNIWANDQYIAWLDKVTPEALDEAVPSSFPSIRQTLLHIWDAQHIWLERLQGRIPVAIPSKTHTCEWPEICKGVRDTASNLLLLGRSKEEKWFDVPFR